MKIASLFAIHKIKERPLLKGGTCQMSSVVVMNRVTKLKQQKTTSSSVAC